MEESYARLDLAAFLIMPIQRIPRYVLLLQELKKATPEYQTEQHANISKALEKIKQVADVIDGTLGMHLHITHSQSLLPSQQGEL